MKPTLRRSFLKQSTALCAAAFAAPAFAADDGLPVGLQLVGRFRQDAALLQAACAFESAADLLRRWPADAAGSAP